MDIGSRFHLTRTHRLQSGAFLAMFGLAMIAACGRSTNDTCEETSTCAPSSSGGPEGGDGPVGDGPVVDAPEGCDASADPKDAPKCVVNEFGVFVDATGGADGNPGTKQSPVKSITAALGKLNGKPRIYVCAGTYADHVNITSAASIFGGFACSGWTYDGNKPKVAPADVGYALTVSGVAATIADLELIAQPGTAMATSSIAVSVVSSPQLTLRRVKVDVGAGFKGDDGEDALPGVSTPALLDGNIGAATTGGTAKPCTCSTGGTSKGGRGGDTSGATQNGDNGETAQATPSPSTATGIGGARNDCEAGAGNGKPGSAAPPAGSAAAPSLGILDAAGWHPGDGSKGTNGIPGQGGGGGGSFTIGTPAQNGGGGSGACGGCGGGGGGGGKGGGASIALVSFQSTLTFEASELITSNAGAGGTGKAGEAGAGGGNGGNGLNSGCKGGPGGTGGNGGGGSGGAGGLSVGVLFKGPKPTIDAATTVTNGDKGAAGGGGSGNDGPDGQKAPSLEIQ